MNESKDKLIAIRIDSAMSSCFEMISNLMYMRTVSSETDEGRNQLLSILEENIDVQKALIIDLKELNILI